MRRILPLAAILLSAFGCQRPAPSPPSIAQAPAAYALGDLLGSGELRGFAIQPGGLEVVASLRSREGWSLTSWSLKGGTSRTLACDPPLAGERLLSLSPRGDVAVLRRELPGDGDRGELVARLPTGRLVSLAPAPGVRLRFLGWSAAGGGVVVESDETGPGRRDLVEVRLDDLSRAARLLNDASLRLGPLSQDGRLLAVAATDPTPGLAADPATGPRLGLFELSSGTIREVPLSGIDETLLPQAFSVDAKSLYLLADRSGARRGIRVALADGRLEPFALPCAAARALRLTPGGRYLLVSCDQGISPSLTIVDAENGARVTPPLPEGVLARAVSLADADRVWILGASGSRFGEDLFLWEPSSGVEAQLTYLLDARLEARSLVEATALDPSEPPGGALSAEEYRPLRTDTGSLPAGVVWIDEALSEQTSGGGTFQPVIQYLANHGHTVLHLRLPAEDETPASAGGALDAIVLQAANRISSGPRPPALVGVGRRAGRLALALAGRRPGGWSAVVSVLPGRLPSLFAPTSAPAAARALPPDWIDLVPPPPSSIPMLLVTAESEVALSPADRERLLSRLRMGGARVEVELLPGDGRAFEAPGSRDRAWSRVARSIRSATLLARAGLP